MKTELFQGVKIICLIRNMQVYLVLVPCKMLLKFSMTMEARLKNHLQCLEQPNLNKNLPTVDIVSSKEHFSQDKEPEKCWPILEAQATDLYNITMGSVLLQIRTPSQ